MQYKKDTGIYTSDSQVPEGYVKLPVQIGQKLYTNLSVSCSYLRANKKPYEIKVIFIGINNSPEMCYGIFNVEYSNDRHTQYSFYFTDIGVKVFYTKEEAVNNLNNKQ